MDTTDLDIHLALRQLAVTIELYICLVSHCTSSKPEQSRACIVWSDKEHRVSDPGSVVASIPVLRIKQCVPLATVTFFSLQFSVLWSKATEVRNTVCPFSNSLGE